MATAFNGSSDFGLYDFRHVRERGGLGRRSQ